MRGGFRFFFPNESVFVPNMITNEGEEAYLKMLMQADDTDVAAGGNFYIGLCNHTPDEADTLADITNEPGAAGGYARQAITRDITGFPTIDFVSGVGRAVSALVSFAAAGADYSTAITRAFLCNAAAGSVGVLFSYSGALAAPLLIPDGGAYPVRYELYLD